MSHLSCLYPEGAPVPRRGTCTPKGHLHPEGVFVCNPRATPVESIPKELVLRGQYAKRDGTSWTLWTFLICFVDSVDDLACYGRCGNGHKFSSQVQLSSGTIGMQDNLGWKGMNNQAGQ